jgi:hypothetical protein
MATPPIASFPAADARPLAARIADRLGPSWRCVGDAVIRAWGEEGRVDLAALHPERGIILLGFVEDGDEANPASAVEAFRAMLADDGFAERFPGHLPVVALTASPATRARLVEKIEEVFADGERPTVAPGWVDWLEARLDPAAAETHGRATPRLVAPRRDEVPARGGASALAVPGREPPVRSADAGDNWRDWSRQLGFALAVVAILLGAMAIFTRAATLF